MKIDDFILLGRAVPVRLKSDRVTVCAAGISEQAGGLIRIYPTKADMNLRRWDVCEVEIEQTQMDNRKESWKIIGSHDQWENLGNKIKKIGEIRKIEDKKKIIMKNLSPCTSVLNEERRSLGIIKPSIHNYYLKKIEQEKKKNSYAITLDEYIDPTKSDVYYQRWVTTKDKFEIQPYIEWNCANNCKIMDKHKMQVLEWGIYEWFRKFPNKKEQVWNNLQIDNSNYEKYFLVGNQANQRTSFLIISILRWKIDKTAEKNIKLDTYF